MCQVPVPKHTRRTVNPAPNTIAVDRGNCERFTNRFVPCFAEKLADYLSIALPEMEQIKDCVILLII